MTIRRKPNLSPEMNNALDEFETARKSVLDLETEEKHIAAGLVIDQALSDVLGERHGFIVVFVPDGGKDVGYCTNLSANDARSLCEDVAVLLKPRL